MARPAPARLALLALTVSAVLAAGCAALGRSRVRTAAGELSAPTAVAAPARLDVVEARDTLPLPAGTVITLPAASTLTREIRTETASTAVGHPPPSPAEMARASGVRAFWLAGLACLLVAGLLVWRGHVLAAVCAGAAGLALPVLASVLSSGVALTAGVGLLAAAGAFFVAWHLLRGRAPSG